MRELMVVVLVLCAAQSWAESDVPRVVTEKRIVLPERLLETLNREFPDYRLPELEDYRIPHPERWNTGVDVPKNNEVIYPSWFAVGDSAVPYACWGDFNGDSLTDVALMVLEKKAYVDTLLEKRKSQPMIYITSTSGKLVPAYDTTQWVFYRPMLLIFEQTEDGYRAVNPSPEFPITYLDCYVHTLPAGMIEPFPATEADVPVKADFQSVEWVNYGKSACAFYLKDGKYVQIWTGD